MAIQWVPAAKAMALFGLLEAFGCSCTAACLLGISLNRIFAILFCVLMFVFAIAFGVLAWKSGEDRFMRILAIGGAVLMPIAAICCLCVDESIISFRSSNAAAKTPLYMIVAVAVMIDFAINIIQLVKCLPCSDMKNRLLTNNHQILAILLINIVLGLADGLAFGLMKPEVDDRTEKMTIVAIIFLFIGLIVGALWGLYNEVATQKVQSLGIDPALPTTEYDRM